MNIINIDKNKCVGCNSCMRVCPVPDANIARYIQEDKMVIDINHEKCIQCGACIKACAHSSRYYEDDTERFFSDLKKKEEIVLITAPAIKIAFDGNWSGVLEWLCTLGVKKIYNVSLGADICTWAHIRYLEQNPNKKLISQPCPVIVSYILKYKKELIPYLSPIQSPMLCLAIYLKQYLNFSGKIAALSPCIAKKEEFEQTGKIDYNVTLYNIKKYLEEHQIKISSLANQSFNFAEEGFEGSLYSRPGGLKESLLTHQPKLRIISSEGIRRVYPEFEQYANEKSEYLPQIFDVLNCQFGCNGGPAIGQEYTLFKVNNIMNEIKIETEKKRKRNKKWGKDKQFCQFDKQFKLQDFIRIYKQQNISLDEPNKEKIEQVFSMMGKKTKEQRTFDCHACGYSSCEEMAAAIAKGLNVPENCHQYTMRIIEKEKLNVARTNQEILEITHELTEVFSVLEKNIENIGANAEEIGGFGKQGSENMKEVSKYLKQLIGLNEKVKDAMKSIVGNVSKYKEMTTDVEEIAEDINLLSLNASIEAAKAGEAGKGFAVVASNIRNLSENSKVAVGSAKENEEGISYSIKEVSQVAENLDKQIKQLLKTIEQTMEQVEKSSERSKDIQLAMESVRKISNKIQEMIEKTNELS